MSNKKGAHINKWHKHKKQKRGRYQKIVYIPYMPNQFQQQLIEYNKNMHKMQNTHLSCIIKRLF